MNEYLILEELEEQIMCVCVWGRGGGGGWGGISEGAFKSQVSYTCMFIFSNMKHWIS